MKRQLLAAALLVLGTGSISPQTTGREVEIVRLSGEWAWSPDMNADNPGVEWMQRGCDDPNSTMFPSEFVQNCYRVMAEKRLYGWSVNLSVRSNVGVVLACLKIKRAAGGGELLGCANCGSSGGGCTSSVGEDFGDGYRTLLPGDEIGIRMDGYGTPCAGLAADKWAPTFFCESPVEIQAGVLF